MRFANRMKAAAVFLLVPLVTGCWNMHELEHMYYAHAIGIDFQEGQYKLYVQILDFSTLGKQEGGGAKKGSIGGAWVGEGSGRSIQSALHNLYASSQRRIYWGHLNSIVLSEEILKLGVHEVMDILTRYNELRYTLWVFGTRGPLKNILLASPILEASPVYPLLGDPNDLYSQSSFIAPVHLYRLISDMKERGRTPLLPLIQLTQGHWADKEEIYTSLGLEGVAVLSDDKWIGWLA